VKAVKLTTRDLRFCPVVGTDKADKLAERIAEVNRGQKVGERQAKLLGHSIAERRSNRSTSGISRCWNGAG